MTLLMTILVLLELITFAVILQDENANISFKRANHKQKQAIVDFDNVISADPYFIITYY